MWQRLLRIDAAYDRIAVFDHVQKRVYPAPELILPWPAAVALGSFHRKHVLVDPRLPSVKQLARDLNEFSNRLKWMWWHRNEGNQRPFLRLIRSAPPSFPNVVAPELHAWLYSFRQDILRNSLKKIAVHRLRASRPTNAPTFLDVGAKWLDKSNLSVFYSDKDHKLVLVPRSEVPAMTKQFLDSCGHYRPVPFGLGDAYFNAAVSLLGKLASDMQQHYKTSGLSRMLRSTIADGPPHFHRRLSFNIKTHKCQGEIGLRAIHGGPRRSTLGPLGCWLKQWCQTQLQKYQSNHLIKNSRQLVADLSGRVFNKCIIAGKIDIKEYFLTGDFKFLIDVIVEIAEPVEKHLVGRIVSLLLNNQFVKVESLGETYQVTTGAGMGLNFAGELADLVLFWLAERSISNPFVQYYGRFKDDVLILFERRRDCYMSWLKAFKRKCSPYKVKLETLSSTTVEMLDVRINIHNSEHSCRLSVEPYTKPTANKIPLTTDSAHSC